MNYESSIPSSAATVNSPSVRRFMPSLCWSSIIGGTVAAIGFHLLLTALGVGAGLATFTPMTDANPITNFSIGAAIIWAVCSLISLAFGGFIAGRFSHSLHSGFAHGILVWSLTLIISLLLLTAGTGMVLGGALKVLGDGMGMGGNAVAVGVGELAKESVQRGSDQLASFTDEAMQSLPTSASAKASTRAKREIGFAVAKLFAPGNDIASQDNRTAVIKALVDHTQMSRADATKVVDEWTAFYESLRVELARIKDAAELKAREIADKGASNLSSAAIWSFFALLFGLLVAALAGRWGAGCAVRHAESDCATARRMDVR
ncbi:MAG: hypothetical protein SFY80_16660 [Verrucomicrobiota bacterium]|nr:hypothetical protein [Verrucomicrobiota bacterium]